MKIGNMHIAKAVFGPSGLAITTTAMPTNNTQLGSNIMTREVNTHSNFSEWCSNITPYGSSTSTVQAWCGQGNSGASSVQYISHIGLNQCLSNFDGRISGATE